MFYWSKLYSQEIHKGEEYEVLHKTIVILITNFELNKLKEMQKFHTKWQIREEKYREKILTDTLEVHIIELPKMIKQFNQNIGNKKEDNESCSKIFLNPENAGDEDMKESDYDEKLVLWSMFLLNPDAISEEDLNKNEDIKKAKEELERIRKSEKEQRLAELRIKHILDQNSIRKSGFREGKEEGKKENQLETAKKLLDLKMTIAQITQITGLTAEEIKVLNK